MTRQRGGREYKTKRQMTGHVRSSAVFSIQTEGKTKAESKRGCPFGKRMMKRGREKGVLFILWEIDLTCSRSHFGVKLLCSESPVVMCIDSCFCSVWVGTSCTGHPGGQRGEREAQNPMEIPSDESRGRSWGSTQTGFLCYIRLVSHHLRSVGKAYVCTFWLLSTIFANLLFAMTVKIWDMKYELFELIFPLISQKHVQWNVFQCWNLFSLETFNLRHHLSQFICDHSHGHF